MGSAAVDIIAVLFAIVAIVAIAGFLRSSSSPYDRIGAGGISVADDDRDLPEGRELTRRRTRETEIRQMLQARSERLEREGLEPLDVDAELARLLAGGEVGSDEGDAHAGEDPRDGAASHYHTHRHDPELLAEVHQLVAARNERRARAGEPPLDVESEVARRLADLAG